MTAMSQSGDGPATDKPSPRPPSRTIDRIIGISMMILGLLCFVVMFWGCAQPPRKRLVQLLHECREANRERIRIIKEYETEFKPCEESGFKDSTLPCFVFHGRPAKHPEQSFDCINFGEAGE